MQNKTIIIFIGLALIAALVYTLRQNDSVPQTNTQDPATEQPEQNYIGLSPAAAEAKAEAENTPFRVVEIDSESLPVTMDYRPGRINATVENGMVVDYTIEGANEEPALEEPNTEDYIGLSPTAAEAKAESENTLFRVVEIDGEPQPTTRDYRPGRINAVVENGVVVDYYVEGAGEEPDNQATEPTDPIIGMTVAEAETYAEANDIVFRVGAIDGDFLMLTEDYRPGRITAEVEGDVVVDYSVE